MTQYNSNYLIAFRKYCIGCLSFEVSNLTYQLIRDDWIQMGEWPSRLKRCNENRKIPGSDSTRRPAGIRNPTSLRGSRWPSDVPSMAQNGWCTEIYFKHNNRLISFLTHKFLGHIFLVPNWNTWNIGLQNALATTQK